MEVEIFRQADNLPDPFIITRLDSFIDDLCKVNSNYIYFRLDQDFLERDDIIEYFKSLRNKIICIVSGDIDFPPPKKPYNYEKYFNESKLPSNHKSISYYEKVHLELLNIMEENNLYVASIDVSVNHQRALNLPLGIYHEWNHSIDYDEMKRLRKMSKSIACYANYSISPVPQWFGSPRSDILELIKANPDITIENTCIFMNERKNTNLDNFYQKIAMSKFAICPRGWGIDTYRLWDCLYLGTIPIVEKYDGHAEFEDLPILFIDSIDFYKTITSEQLNAIYESMMAKKYNYDKLNFSYWKERVLDLEKKLAV